MDVEKWKKDLKNSRWYGPFVWNKDQTVIIFHSVTNEGFFDGVALGIELGSKRIYFLSFRDNGIEITKGFYSTEGGGEREKRN